MFYKNQINIECITCHEELIDLVPITHGSKNFPTWFKKLITPTNQQSNVKKCPGIIDLYKKSILINAWQDFSIDVNSVGQYQVNCPNGLWGVDSHPIEVQATNAWPGYLHLKLKSPWFIKEGSGVSWLMTQNVWGQNDPNEFVIIPGVVEFRANRTSNVHMLIKIPNQGNKHIDIKAGDPLVTLTPCSNKKINLKTSLVDFEKLKNVAGGYQFSVTDWYFRKRKMYELKGKK